MAVESDVLERPDTVSTGSDNHEVLSHIVRKEDQDNYWLTGEPVTALCGKKWQPTRDPDRYPLCQTCKEQLDIILGR